MRRVQVVALCLAVGALIAAAITPGVIGSNATPQTPSPASMVRPGFTIDRVVTDNTGPLPSVFVEAHSGPRQIKPGEPGYVPPPKPGQPGYEPSTASGR